MRLRIDLGYDGTDFHGWATQPGLRTVQERLEAALALILGGGSADAAPAPRLTVAGRTDAGVHARGQVAHVDVADEMADRLTARRVNGALARVLWPEHSRRSQVRAADVVVHAIAEAPEGFDARFSALRRRYEYRVAPRDAQIDVLATRFTAQVAGELDLGLMQAASYELLGLRDFTSFCKAREGATAVRDLLVFDWVRDERGVLVARVEADAFCHSMVRALVGSAVAAGSGRLTLSELVRLREARERTNRFAVMAAHGLSLEAIVYPDAAGLHARAEQTRARRDPPSPV